MHVSLGVASGRFHTFTPYTMEGEAAEVFSNPLSSAVVSRALCSALPISHISWSQISTKWPIRAMGISGGYKVELWGQDYDYNLESMGMLKLRTDPAISNVLSLSLSLSLCLCLCLCLCLWYDAPPCIKCPGQPAQVYPL